MKINLLPLLLTILLLSKKAFAQPPSGTYTWDSYTSVTVLASDLNTATYTWPSSLAGFGYGYGWTASATGTRAGTATSSNVFRVVAQGNASGGANTWLRIEDSGTGVSITSASFGSVDGKEFKLTAIKIASPNAQPQDLVITARRNGVTTGSVSLPGTTSTFQSLNLASNANFKNIDELVFSGFTAVVNNTGGLRLDDITVAGPDAIVPVLNTGSSASVTSTSANLTGNATDDGNGTITERGIVWGAAVNPTTATNKVAHASGGTGVYTVTATSLPSNSLVHYRAYAINSAGTSYGSDQSFTTLMSLPLHLISFDGKSGAAGVTLSWTTDSEVNVESFAVERSGDGTGFSAIGTVPANNSNGTNHYGFTDVSAPAVAYYRLRMIDKDGSFEFSPVLSIRNSAGNISKYVIYPNPVTGNELTVAISMAADKDATFNVIDAAGRIWLKQKIAASVLSTGKAVLPVAALPQGVYYLQVRENKTGKLEMIRFIKR